MNNSESDYEWDDQTALHETKSHLDHLREWLGIMSPTKIDLTPCWRGVLIYLNAPNYIVHQDRKRICTFETLPAAKLWGKWQAIKLGCLVKPIAYHNYIPDHEWQQRQPIEYLTSIRTGKQIACVSYWKLTTPFRESRLNTAPSILFGVIDYWFKCKQNRAARKAGVNE